MQTNKMKNIIVLNNLPSNIIEEAFVILKPNVKIEEGTFDKRKNETILKEAENVVNNYVSEMNAKAEKNSMEKDMKVKYKRLKICNIFLFIAFALTVLIAL